MRTPSLLFGLMLTATAVGAQTPATQSFEGQVDVSEILLDVVATDRDGAVVRGLGIDDFQVKEDGRSVDLTGVSFYATAYDADRPDDPSAAADIPASRYFILLFHDQKRNASPSNRLLRQQLEAGRETHNWIRDEMAPSDWVAVASYDVKLSLHQDFTQDRDTLLYAVERAARGARAESLNPRERRRQESRGPSLLRNLPAEDQLGKQTTRMYDAIRLLADATGPLVGRKNLLLFSIGFGELDGSSPYNRPDRRFYRPMEEALNANNVAVYPIDLMPTGIEHSQTSFLNQLAADSGGFYHHGFISFVTPLRRIAKENTGYYALSYRSEHAAGETGYRNISVRSTRKKIKVRARRGFRYGSTVAAADGAP